MSEGKFIKKKTYYTGVVYEWNLPTGTTCPFALECKVTVDRLTGKFDVKKGQYRCYAASAERFPGVREHRWKNFELVKNGGIPTIPKDCTAIRIHMRGDFFNQKYFEMWAYTKSLRYWVNRINDIPNNLVLTASYGGREDYLIEEYNLKNVKVYANPMLVPTDRPVDNNDDWARKPTINFALLDNMKVSKKSEVEEFNKSFSNVPQINTVEDLNRFKLTKDENRKK
jgi:hypothetical protein